MILSKSHLTSHFLEDVNDLLPQGWKLLTALQEEPQRVNVLLTLLLYLLAGKLIYEVS